MTDCWCVAYHFTDLDGREVCEHECHGGELDAVTLAEELEPNWLLSDQEIEVLARDYAARAFRGEIDPPVNAAGYLRGVRLIVDTWVI